MFLLAIEEQPSVRVENAVGASLSKYVQVMFILFKEIHSVLHHPSSNIQHIVDL